MARPPYLPFLSGPLTLAPGLRPIDPENWLYPDTEAGIWLPEKRRIMRKQREEVFASQAENAVLEDVAARLAGGRALEGGWPTPLEAAAASLSDDICVLTKSGDGLWRLVAASLVAPTFWRLTEKMGAPLAGLHDPVPGASPGMVSRIHRMFDALRPGQVLERFNWTVQPGPERFTPSQAAFLETARTLPEDGALDALFLRVERQTISKQARTGAAVFTIRVAVDPLRAALSGEGYAGAFRNAWEGIDPLLARYKGWPVYQRLVRAALAQAGIGG